VSPTPLSEILIIPSEAAGRRLDQWLVSQLPDASRVRIQQLIEQNKVLVNGSPAKSSFRIRGGEKITITGAVDRPPLKAFPEEIPLDVVYEDDSLVVLNKPAGMVVHAGSGKDDSGNRGTLVNALLHRFGRLSEAGGDVRPGIVHRLDKDTSGLIIVAKTDQAHRDLSLQFSRRQTEKKYIALVHGWIEPENGTVRTPISRDLIRRTRMTTRRSQGRDAVTHWHVARRVESAYGRFSLLDIRIETGRTHQIRVHLSSIGHPVVGDALYGAPRELHPTAHKAASRLASREAPRPRHGHESLALRRNFLHAAAIQFVHPVTRKPASFEQPLPEDLSLFLAEIGGK
jgi:23S rRNA pseudouridine1911/1915/1917 synthase